MSQQESSSLSRRNPLTFPVIRLLLSMAILGLGLSFPAWGAELGTGTYLLGYRSSMAGYMGPPGTYLRNDVYAFQSSFEFPLPPGKIEARRQTIADITNLTWVTPYKIFDAYCGLSATWGSVVGSLLKTQDIIPGQSLLSGKQGYTGVGDLSLSPLLLGWHLGQFHIIAQAHTIVPIGSYDVHRAVNTGLHRWSVDPFVAVTWLHPQRHHEISCVLGYTVNFKNPATQYLSGNELHGEFFVGQHLPYNFALGLTGYFYKQITGDRGAGAVLGSFYGRALALGPCLTYHVELGGHYLCLEARYYNELEVKNRPKGQSVFFTVWFGLNKNR
jgi:hypothetical protein